VAAAGELPRVDEVAVVGDLHAVLGGPDEATHRRLGVDEAAVVDDLDRRDPGARRDAGHAYAVECGCDGSGDVRAVVTRGGVPGGLGGVGDPAEAGHALVLRDLGDEVGMRAGDAAVQHADDHVRAPGGDR